MRIFIVRIFFILAAVLIFPKTVAATVVTIPGVSYASITIDYTFTLGTVTDTLRVNSVSVVVGGPSSAYSTILPENSLFTGFTPLAAPSCGAGLTCLDDFGILNAGRPGGLDPFSNFWVGTEVNSLSAAKRTGQQMDALPASGLFQVLCRRPRPVQCC
jgi:hypothetical protein